MGFNISICTTFSINMNMILKSGTLTDHKQGDNNDNNAIYLQKLKVVKTLHHFVIVYYNTVM